MRDVAIVSFAQSNVEDEERNEVEILLPVAAEAVKNSGLARNEIDFTCSGSSDWLQGQPFAFVMALDAVGAWPPIKESHVEMDGAWALYEAWVKIQTGEVESALVYSFGKTSPGDIALVQALQLDPYCVTPLWPDLDALSAIQARQGIEAGKWSEEDMQRVVINNLSHAADNPHSVRRGDYKLKDLMREPYVASPLRARDCPANSDGATAMVIMAGDRAKQHCERPTWIRGFQHAIDPPALGTRDLLRAPSAQIAAQKAGVASDKIDFAEITAPYSHQELILREELGLAAEVLMNPSGGSLGAHTLMSCGLNRIGDAATRISKGQGDRAVAHAAQGPCLQQNLVVVLEGE